MIYTVTFNPSLDYIVSVRDFKLGITNRTSDERILPGGQGITFQQFLRILELITQHLVLYQVLQEMKS